MLLYVYVASLVVGGILLLASLFLGGDDAHGDAGGHGDLDAGGGGDGDAALDSGDAGDAGHDGGDAVDHDGHDGAGHGDVWLPILSVRFWVFLLAFFGLTGTAFTLLGLAGAIPTLALSSLIGLGSGLGASWVLHRLARAGAGGVTTVADLRGRPGTAMLPMEPGERGKVRVVVGGGIVDLLARSTDPNPIERGRTVVVYDFDGDVALVVAAPELEG